MIESEKITGLVSAPFTPMYEDGSINVSKIREYADFTANLKIVKGVFICGTTGESASLTTEERMAVAEAWTKYAEGRFKVIVHVGGTSMKQSEELAAHAQKCGAYAIGAIAPFFFKPERVEDLVNYFKPIAAAADKIPFYYYNMPSISGVSLSVVEFLKQGSREIPTLRGVKFTHNNLMEMNQCIHLNDGQFDILHGFDEILITGVALGVKGAVGSTYNYVPAIYQGIFDAMAANDLDTARKLQYESVKILDVVIRHGGGVRGGKQLMKLAGIDCGDCRLPIKPVTKEEFEQIKRELEETEFFNIIKEYKK